MKRHRQFFLGFAVLLLAGCEQGLPPNAEPPTLPASVVQTLPFSGSGNHLFAYDVDGDGRLDLGATAHGASHLQIFFQDAPRVFSAGPEIEGVGFHPWDVTPVVREGALYLFVDGEGEGAHIVLRAEGRKGAEPVARHPGGNPRNSAPVPWPGWEQSWLVSPFSGSAVTLYKGFDLLTGQVAQELRLETGPEPMRPSTVDLDGDGIPELVFGTKKTGQVWVVRAPPEGVEPRAEVLITGERWDATKDVLAADLNDDGAPDLLLGQERYARIDVYLNDGHGGFTRGPRLKAPAKAGPAHFAVATDRDGTQYIAAGNYRNTALFLRKTREESEFRMLSRDTAGWANFLLLRDIDGDGWLDLAMVMQRETDALRIIYGPLQENFPGTEPL